MDISEVSQWVAIGMMIGFLVELPVGVLSLWLYDWYLDPFLELREERRRRRIASKEVRKKITETQPQLPEETKSNLTQEVVKT